MYNRIKVTQINDHIWLMDDNNEGTGYLVTGRERGLIIDTMNGYENVKELAERFTSLPLTVVNTHGHPDHIYGNVYFEQAYLHPADIPIAESFYENETFQEQIQKAGLKPAAFLPAEEGMSFDLGGLVLEVYELPGHTPGGIVLLDRQDRILFTGDSINGHTWMQLPESLPMDVFLKSLKKVQELRDAFDYILTGHSHGLVEASFCDAHIRAVEEVCNGERERDEPYIWFGGTCMAHPYKDMIKIVYDHVQKTV